MRLIDTHCHLCSDKLAPHVNELVERATNNGVDKIINITFDQQTLETGLKQVEQLPSLWLTVGIQPHDADQHTPELVRRMESIAMTHEKVVAIGEIGLDGGVRTASVCAINTSLCAMVSGDTVAQQRETDPALQTMLSETANTRNRKNTQLMAQTLFHDIFARMTHFLESRVTLKTQQAWYISERITHQEIANRIGCSREMVSRLIKDLERGNYLTRNSNHTFVLHPPMPMSW